MDDPGKTQAAPERDESPTGQAPASGPPPVAVAQGKGRLSFFRELPVLILIAFGLAMLIKTFLVQAFFIPSESMLPTLEIGDRVLVNKLVYRLREPRRGEIIVFVGEADRRPRPFLRKVRDFIVEGFGVARPAERDFIKRVIALPGETIQIRKRRVFITPVRGKRFELPESYLSEEPDESSFGPFTVPADRYFVMGDNRPSSSDSRRSLGPIHRRDIVGRAFVRIWPPRRLAWFRRPTYARTPDSLRSGPERGSRQPTAARPVTVLALAATGFTRRRVA